MLRISLKQFVPVIIMAAGLLLFGTNLCNAQSGNSSGGVYKTEFTNIPDSAYQIGGKTLGTHCVVKRISLGEPSTGEIMADFSFPDGVNTASYKNPNDKVQYWVERVQDATGKTVALKVSSTAANIPYLNLTMYSADGELPELNIYGLKPDGNVVYSPDGSALSKPYEDPALKIGGFKELRFKAEKYDKGVKAKEMVEKAGYETASARYEDKVYSFGVHSTQDGRAKIERDVLKKKYWFPVKSETEGNRGLYELRDTLDLNIESHSNEETVKTQKIKIQGSISNPAGEFDKVTKIQIVISNGTDKKDFDATLTGDSTFTADAELYTGTNYLVFLPFHLNSEGKEVNYKKYKVTARENPIDALTLEYDSGWKSKIAITRKTTKTTGEPHNSETVHISRISANLDIDFVASKLWYIQKSPENAKNCSEFANCWLFTGTDDGNVTVSEEFRTKTKNCEDELPLITTIRSKGNATLDKYMLNIAATLTPSKDGDISSGRRYHLTISGSPEFAVHTNAPWPSTTVEQYDCLLKKWNADRVKIAPLIKLDRTDAVLKFPSSEDLENYVKSPVSAKSWTFTGEVKTDDGYSVTVTEYTVTLTIIP